jgi:two-component system sensor histidine kinase AlgZ
MAPQLGYKKDMGILSTFATRALAHTRGEAHLHQPGRLLFDNCQLGMVLRAVVLVESVLAIGLLYSPFSSSDWLAQLALLTGVALPATLVWLVAGCACKTWLLDQAYALQIGVGLALGALCGLLATVGLRYMLAATSPGSLPWLANSLTGAGLAGMLLLQASLRRRAVIPENTSAQLRQLQSRIQPHFLFNSLNSAMALVKKEPEKAEALLQDLSDLFRSALSQTDSTVRLEDELQLIRQYLAIETLRFGDRMRVHWHIDPTVLETQVVPLMLQPLVENAVKHGIEPSEHPGEIWIYATRQAQSLELRIDNTLPQQHEAGTPGMGMGLRNVADRLALFYDLEAQLQAAIQDRRYRVFIRIPLKTAMAITHQHAPFV